MYKSKVIVKVGVELGSIALHGMQAEQGWKFWREVNDQAPDLLDEEPIHSKSATVDTWAAALELLDKYPWATFYPVFVDPDFKGEIWDAVEKRLNDDSEWELERWRAVCGITDVPNNETREVASTTHALFLPGVPEAHVRKRLEQSGGDEIGSGNFTNPESSAALAVNAWGWLMDGPAMLRGRRTGRTGQIEYSARFPWAGGDHPWLDAVVITASHLIGLESKRSEPFRDNRLGRNLRHLINTVHDLTTGEIGLRVLTGQGAAIDTTTAAGKPVFGTSMRRVRAFLPSARSVPSGATCR